jgi:NitT/TauT family transport system ATP-binding protein
MDATEPQRSGPDGRPPAGRAAEIALEVHELSVVYEREEYALTAVDRVSFDVFDGEFVCVVGASGCGKTTLLKAINGLVPPTSGMVRVRGRLANPRSGDMAMVFQQDSLFPWRTVEHNVRFGLDVRGRRARDKDERARDAIKLVKLSGFEHHYPHELSGGMRQRANLARAFTVDPEVLLMDEPFASLDAQTREVMQTELLEIWNRDRKTVLFITHQLDEAVILADRIIVMSTHPGRIRETVEIDIPRPRDLQTKRTPEFVAYVDHIWHLIEAEVRSSVFDEIHQ